MKTILTIGVLVLLILSTTPGEVIHVIADERVSPSVVRTVSVYVTKYSSVDSCHYPVKEGCLTASGKVARDGYVACHRKYKFGTKFQVNDRIYVCMDRYASYLDRMRGIETIDIWMGSGRSAHERAKKWGIKKMEVGIVE